MGEKRQKTKAIFKEKSEKARKKQGLGSVGSKKTISPEIFHVYGPWPEFPFSKSENHQVFFIF